ncbi:hypothetical protein KJ866_01840 [Patescibacteria group bacterium]|nr:hypothetical protein [Patescibacteria group bacterium]MBU2219662.1 hypothetical protein [Patescibacteria group bacterium]MBU2264801.1 hypothetical protein [Patescibacteria group bacterium]
MKTKVFFTTAIIIIAAVAIYLMYVQRAVAPMSEPTNNNSSETTLSESEALVIAQNSDCAKSGQVQEESFYNPNSKTWWFTLKADKAGCSPACVVAEDKTVEINWRCTGLIIPTQSAADAIKELFIAKYPKYAATLSISVDKEDDNYVRGNVIFETGAPGGIFLAAKIDGQWQLLFDGNGSIPCSLAEYGFPADMLSDCAG